MIQNYLYIALFVFNLLVNKCATDLNISVNLTKVWGPGLQPQNVVMPARYFFIEAVNTENQRISADLGPIFDVVIEGKSKLKKGCRVWTNLLNRKDGTYIVRYKLYDPCTDLVISLKYRNEHIAESPYRINEASYPDDCDCPNKDIHEFLNVWQCGELPTQISTDLSPFSAIDWDELREKVIEKFNQPQSISLCHYVIKDNAIYRNCYGKYVGFKMFMDSILLSLTRKLIVPDVEFFVNLGDWPLVKTDSELFPIFSWCGSEQSHDIVMPTYDITESSLENMGRVMLDILSVQGNSKDSWKNRTPKVFWRGRDSNQHRLDLIDISRKNAGLFNVSLTNFFFFRDKQEQYGPKSDHVSFFDFFIYKYQLSIDGTVAAYRFPYLLAGGSLVMKQDSIYYEHFYSDLKPHVHYVPIKKDLSDLVDRVNWAITNDEEAQLIANKGQEFANENLLPQHVFCYYVHLLNEFSKRITSKITLLEGMEKVQQLKQQSHCDCQNNIKDEL